MQVSGRKFISRGRYADLRDPLAAGGFFHRVYHPHDGILWVCTNHRDRPPPALHPACPRHLACGRTLTVSAQHQVPGFPVYAPVHHPARVLCIAIV